jgi:peptide/nickel transport system permease protein
MTSVLKQPAAPLAVPEVETSNLKVEIATQWQLMWWKFKKHRLAVLGGIVVILFYMVALFADFFAPNTSTYYEADYVYAPPQTIQLFRDGGFAPFVYGYKFERDPRTFRPVWEVDTEVIVPIGLFVRREPYNLLGIIPTDIHFFGPTDPTAPFFLWGADKSGRDVFSRIIFSAQVSLSVGLVGVAISMTIGILLGGIAGLKGGQIDNLVQRTIEIIMSVPTLPIIIAIAAAVPLDWSALQVYFIITLLFAITGWTGLARVVRSKFLAVREEDYVMAAKLDGSNNRRLIITHMLPSFYSHIIASLTLALPGMIIGETALSFLGVGLRPPVVSWGVMLQEAQKVAVISEYPWLLLPAVPVIIIVLAFNFLGDGLRDAADPY